MSSLGQRIQRIEAQLQQLPVREPGESGGSTGLFVYHSKRMTSFSDTVTIDLENVYPIDRIALIPTRLQNVERQMEAVGFPIRFEMVGSESETFSDPIVFYDGAQTHYPDPNGYPVLFDGQGQKARYLRMVVYDMPLVRGFHAFSLAELFVFSAGRNVALKKEVKTSSSATWAPHFHDTFLVDGQTSLGQPTRPSKNQPSGRGWHAKVQGQGRCDEGIELHFESAIDIEEVRLYPVYHSIWPKSTDYGFPIHFRLQIKEQNGDWITVEDWSKRPFPPPGNSPVFIPVKSRKADAVRLQVLSLPQSIPSKYIFALAEMEVYAHGTNVAPLGNIISSSLHDAYPTEWCEQALTDGWATRGKIIPQLTWLEGLAQRGRLEAALANLVEQRTQQQLQMTRVLRTTVSVLSGSLVLAGGLMIYNRKRRRQQVLKLKNRIASDLHDEVGSNLASITILAAGAQEQCELASSQAQSLHRIVEIAKETSSSMHDIVWMLHPDRKTNMSLTTKLQAIAGSLLADIPFSFAGSEEIAANQLSMDKLHHFLLFYKEVLHNLARHSNATQVDIKLSIANGILQLKIDDNGRPPSSGALPDGLALRAKKMSGRLAYSTQGEHNQLILDIS